MKSTPETLVWLAPGGGNTARRFEGKPERPALLSRVVVSVVCMVSPRVAWSLHEKKNQPAGRNHRETAACSLLFPNVPKCSLVIFFVKSEKMFDGENQRREIAGGGRSERGRETVVVTKMVTKRAHGATYRGGGEGYGERLPEGGKRRVPWCSVVFPNVLFCSASAPGSDS